MTEKNMSGKIITFREIIELNHILENKELKVHLHDTCGSQSCTVEVDDFMQTEDREAVKNVIGEYFLNQGIQTTFINENLEFILN